MMNILLCAATKMESYAAVSPHHKIDFLITGAGSPSTCFQLARQFSICLPDLVIQIGIAGAFDRNLIPGFVVQVSEDTFADLGAQDADGSFIPLSQLVRQDTPFGMDIIRPEKRMIVDGIPEVKAITVNKGHGYLPDILHLMDNPHPPDIETMEGAAFFASCMAFDVPCCQLRSISNLVEPRNRSAWNIPLALKNLHKSLQNAIDQLG